MIRIVYSGSAALLAGVVLVAFAGCGSGGYDGPQRAEVTGTVAFDGAPVANGTINLIPQSEGRQVGVTIIDGTYTFAGNDGPTFGKYKVEIFGFEPKETPEGADEDHGSSKQILPAKFNAETELELDVSGPKLTKDFALTSK